MKLLAFFELLSCAAFYVQPLEEMNAREHALAVDIYHTT